MTQTQEKDPELWALAVEQTEALADSAMARGVEVPDLTDEVIETVYAQLLRNERPTSPATTPSPPPSDGSAKPMTSAMPANPYLLEEDAAIIRFPVVRRLFPDGEWSSLTPEQRAERVAADAAAHAEIEYLCATCQDSSVQLLPEDEVPAGRRYLVADPRTGKLVPQFKGVGERWVMAHCRRCPPATQRQRNLRGVDPHDILECTFERFQVPATSDRTTSANSLRNALHHTVEWASDEGAHPILLLRGAPGVGKSHLAKAAARYMSERGWPVLFTTARGFLDEVKATFDGGQPTAQVVDRYRSAGVLMLDDLGAEYATGWSGPELFALVNDRYEHRQKTLITTNVGGAELQDRQADDLGRLLSRLQDVDRVRVVEITGTDYRTRSRA